MVGFHSGGGTRARENAEDAEAFGYLYEGVAARGNRVAGKYADVSGRVYVLDTYKWNDSSCNVQCFYSRFFFYFSDENNNATLESGEI